MKEAREQIGINAAKSRTCTLHLLSVSLCLLSVMEKPYIYSSAYLVVTLNLSMKYYCKLFQLGIKKNNIEE